jgi:hypothetical protein
MVSLVYHFLVVRKSFSLRYGVEVLLIEFVGSKFGARGALIELIVDDVEFSFVVEFSGFGVECHFFSGDW